MDSLSSTGGLALERDLISFLRRLALVISLSVVIVLPGVYFYLNHSNLIERVNTLVEVKAGAIGILAGGNSELWKYNLARMDELLRRGPLLLTHERAIVRDTAENVLLTVGEPPEAPTLALSAPVYDFGRVVGRVEISHSYRVVILGTLLTALLGLLLGGIVYAASVLPLNVLRRVSAELVHESAALRESEFRWKFAIEGSGDGLWDWNVPESTVFFSTRWKAMLGFAEDDIGGSLDEWSKRVHPDDLTQTMADVQAHLDGKTPLYVNEHRVRCKDGSYKWILDRGLAVSRDAEGKPLRIIGTHADITERKQQQDLINDHNTLLTRQKTELEATMSRIKRLEGLLSICMQCKKIRTESNDWLRLEKYIGENSDATFSHGLCPECLDKELKKLD